MVDTARGNLWTDVMVWVCSSKFLDKGTEGAAVPVEGLGFCRG